MTDDHNSHEALEIVRLLTSGYLDGTWQASYVVSKVVLAASKVDPAELVTQLPPEFRELVREKVKAVPGPAEEFIIIHGGTYLIDDLDEWNRYLQQEREEFHQGYIALHNFFRDLANR